MASFLVVIPDAAQRRSGIHLDLQLEPHGSRLCPRCALALRACLDVRSLRLQSPE
jgi:hypothetical protein